jgi:hypothetical protein
LDGPTGMYGVEDKWRGKEELEKLEGIIKDGFEGPAKGAEVA